MITVVVEHRDRLVRFDVEHWGAALAASGRSGCRVIVLNLVEVTDEVKDDVARDTLVRDMVEVLTLICARLYGRRPFRRNADAAVEAVGVAG